VQEQIRKRYAIATAVPSASANEIAVIFFFWFFNGQILIFDIRERQEVYSFNALLLTVSAGFAFITDETYLLLSFFQPFV